MNKMDVTDMVILELLAEDVKAKEIARELDLSPSTISNRIDRMEKACGYGLIERSKENKRRIKLTANGKRLATKVVKAFKEVING